MKLSSYYVQHICSPTRTALLSARYQIHTGLQDGIIQAWARVCLPPRFGTLADALRSLSYKTHMVGKWHAGIYRDECLPWNRGFDSYYGFLTGSEHHYTKIQRIARGNASRMQLYPDLRTEKGPVSTHCIVPPFAPPPPPPTPCGQPHQPPCHYTLKSGYLPAGGDVMNATLLTAKDAEALCSKSAKCMALTFEDVGGEGCNGSSKCKFYFKGHAGLSSGGGDWHTLYKYPPPPSAQGDPSCYSTHLFTSRAVTLIQSHNATDPFFLYLALQAVHEPIEVPSVYSKPFDGTILDGTRRTYAGMLSAVDECVLNVTTALKANANMYSNSIIVISNDNGGWVGYGGLNTPYRGHKTTLWEGGIRGLGLIVAPGRLPVGMHYNGLFHVTDWLPTLVKAANGDVTRLDPKRFGDLDGIDQWAALMQHNTAAPFPRTEILHNIEGEHGSSVAVIRSGQYKLLYRMQKGRGFDGWCDACNNTAGCYMPKGSGPGADKEPKTVQLGGQLCCYAGRPSDYNQSKSCKPMEDPGPRKPLPDDLVYDIEADPSELHDLAPSRPDLVTLLHERLDHYNESNTPCCICTGSQRTEEMEEPPIDGFWDSFRDQSANPSADCKLQNEPP